MELEKILNELIFELNSKGLSIGSVEQCTYGLVGASIASKCGVNGQYHGTLTVCSKDNVNGLADVSENIVRNYGMVSSQVARQMAIGGIYRLKVNLCISVVGDLENGVFWICTARETPKMVNFRYKHLTLKGSNSEKMEKVLYEALEVTLLHVLEDVNG